VECRCSRSPCGAFSILPESLHSHGGSLIAPHGRYRYRHFSPTWESIPTSIHVFWLLASFVHDVDVIYLPTYTPTKMERQNPQTYADNMQRVRVPFTLRHESKRPVSSHSTADERSGWRAGCSTHHRQQAATPRPHPLTPGIVA
jgi:hypothetical protein